GPQGGALEDAGGGELLPGLYQLFGRLEPILRHDDPLDLSAQLETVESRASRLSHEPRALIDRGHLPGRHVVLRAAAREGDAREVHGVGLLRGQREEAWAIAPDHDGRMGLLDGQRVNLVAGDSIVLAGEIDFGSTQQALD